MAVPIDLLNNSPPESSDEEDFSDSEVSYSSEDDDDSMEDETSEESENTNGGSETDEPNGTEDEFWIKYPYLKNRLVTIAAEGLLPESFLERAKFIGDEKAKDLNDVGKALFIMEMESCKDRCDLVVSAISVMKKSGN